MGSEGIAAEKKKKEKKRKKEEEEAKKKDTEAQFVDEHEGKHENKGQAWGDEDAYPDETWEPEHKKQRA